MSYDSLLLLAAAVALFALFAVPLHARTRRREARTEREHRLAMEAGLHEPVSLHPVVDADLCICSGNCVAACPEDVLGIRDGQATAIAAARCVGHGLCERACPVNAIKLVFGTATRGIEIPRIRENFETNVPGLYIIGELGGMGLIRNAFEQARQCITGIVREGARSTAGDTDLAIIGCGPAGLAASLHALERNVRFLTLEKEDIGGTVRYYPRKKIVMTGSVDVPGYGRLSMREIEKERLVDLWYDIVERTGLEVSTGAAVSAIRRRDDGTFAVHAAGRELSAGRVVLAIGRRGVPRKLGVPGEDSPSVSYGLLEPEAYTGDRILVVGGGDSAVEAALALSHQRGNAVWLSYRGDRLARVKDANRRRFDEAVAGGAIMPLWSTSVIEIRSGGVLYRSADRTETLAVDRVFVLIGGELPIQFLRECGVEIETRFGTPS